MRLHHHFVLHKHDDNYHDFFSEAKSGYHRAHLISTPALFAYLQLLLILGSFFYFSRAANARILGAITFSSREIVALTNAKREVHGLGHLVENEQLDSAAAAKASDMLANDYWAHYSPNGKSPWVFITDAGYKYVYAGENLARDFTDASSVVDAWMNSPTHRANLLDRNFKEIGVSVADGKLGGKEGILVVQMFGSSAVSKSTNISTFDTNKGVGNAVYGEQSKLPVVNASKPAYASLNFNLVRSASLGLLGLVFMLFVIEIIFSAKISHLRVEPRVISHVMLLGIVILALWYSANGAII